MKRKALEKGTILCNKYKITELYSDMGSSALIYKAHPLISENNTGIVEETRPLIIKEFYPVNWSERGLIKRASSNLIYDEDYGEIYKKELEAFKSQQYINNICGYDVTVDARYIGSGYMECFNENGTAYIALSSISGITLDEHMHNVGIPKSKDDLISVVNLIKKIANEINKQHLSGFLNMDIKPDNILICGKIKNGEIVSEIENVLMLDYGSCMPYGDDLTGDLEHISLRITESGKYSSPKVRLLYENIDLYRDINLEGIEDLLLGVSPADDIYSMTVIFLKMLANSTNTSDYNSLIDQIDYLNRAIKDWLLCVIERGKNLDYASIDQLIADLEYLESVLTEKKVNRHVIWSRSIEFYERNKDSRYFRTVHKFILNSTRADIKLPIWGLTEAGEEGLAVDLINKYKDEHIYLHGLGGAGKSFISAEIYMSNIYDGKKIPVYFDLEWLNNSNYDCDMENIIVQGLYEKYYSKIGSIEELIRCFQINSEEKKDYIIIIDNLHKISDEREILVHAALLKILSSYANVQVLLIGRNGMLNDIKVEHTINVLGAESDAVDVHIPYKKGPYELPFFLMKYLEIDDEIHEEKMQRIWDHDTGYIGNDLIWRRNDTATVLYRYFKGIEDYGDFALVNNKNYNLISLAIEKIYPTLAYKKMHHKAILNEKEVESVLKEYQVDLESFVQLSTNNIGVLEYNEGLFEFAHDYYEGYFSGYYLAVIVKLAIEAESMYEIITKAKHVNTIWQQEAANFAIQIVRLLHNSKDEFFIEESVVFNKLKEIKSDSIAHYYKYWPINLCRLFSGYRELYDDFIIDEPIVCFFERNVESVLKWAQLGMEYSCEHSYNFAGELYMLYDKDFPQAIECFKTAGELGLGAAYYNLGLLYLMKINDENKALEYMSMASKMGVVKANVKAANIYIKRKDSALAFNKGVELFEVAAILGNLEAQHALGDVYYFNGENRQYELALEWYKKAADQGYHLSQYMMGCVYLHGSIVEKDIDAAETWLVKSARQENKEAQYVLGCMYLDESSYKKDCVKARKWFIKAGENGHGASANVLGDIFYYGKDVEIDYEEAFYWYEKAATKDIASAQYALGCMYYTGNGTERNYYKAVEQFTQAVEKKYALAEQALGFMYEHGYGVDINLDKAEVLYIKAIRNNVVGTLNLIASLYVKKGKYEKAKKYYITAIAQGENDALYNYGIMYINGEGVEVNIEKGMELLISAANHGVEKAYSTISNIYYKGELVQRNLEKAFEWDKRGAEQGDAKSQYNLSYMYYSGQGTEKNFEEAFKWLKKSAEQNFVSAQRTLGYLYYNGENVEKVLKKAFEWYKKAAEQGDAESQLNLGNMYYNGEGTEQNLKEAFEWYKRAAEQELPNAQFKLGRMYHNGEGTVMDADLLYDLDISLEKRCKLSRERELRKAFEWYKKASEKDSIEAAESLGYMYHMGEGTVKDLEKAFFWYKKAAESEAEIAQNNLAFLYERGSGVEQNYPLAMRWYKKAARNNSNRAMYHIGHLYENGKGVDKDVNVAKEWYKKAATLDIDAMKALWNIYRSEYETIIDSGEAVPNEWYKEAKHLFDVDVEEQRKYSIGGRIKAM